MFNDSATPLGAVLKKISAASGLDKKLMEVSVLDFWEEVVGTQGAKACTIQKLEHGIITVHASAPVWRTELQMRKAEVIQRLNERVGTEVVRDIVFR
jgi:predicted nucleic acid-binding Zn ribbon protein